MLSKAKIKFIKSLQIKKYRKQEQCFLVQGAKSVQELLNSDFETLLIVGTQDYIDSLPSKVVAETIVAKPQDLEGLGEFQSNDSVLAVAKMKGELPPVIAPGEFILALDDIRDPGNLGTILRTADWYGIRAVVASTSTADFYNAKVISATMGSFTRIRFHNEELDSLLSKANGRIYGAFLEGKNVHHEKFEGGGIVVIGNESRGISKELETYITDKITIPRFGRAESLNAAVATAVLCDNIRRNNPV